jgi:uncharacterized protein YqeY
MSLKEKISEDLKQAMRDKAVDKLSALRMLSAAISNKVIALRQGEAVELADEQVIEVVSSEVKKRRDSASEYAAAGRPELAAKEEFEAGVLAAYLPVQMSDEELLSVVRAIIEASGQKDFGLIMKEVMAKHKGQVDGRRVGEMIKRLLS